MGALEIRPAELADVAAITEIYNEAVLHTTATFDIHPHTLESRQAWFKSLTPDYPVCVAKLSGKIAGFGYLHAFAEKDAYRQTVCDTLYIHSDFRGQGVGRAILEWLMRESDRLGYHSMIARITSDNAISIRLHEKHGFVLRGTLHEVGTKFNRALDVCFYQRIKT